jgi:phage terminase small subunit
MGTEKSAYEQLTWKQRAFVDAYLENGFNATRAATKAGYSVDSARSIGAENLTKPDIKAALSERMGELAMGPHETLGRLAAIARSDIGDIFRTVQVDVSGYRVEEGSEEEGSIPTREVTTIDIKKAIEEGRSSLIKSYSTTQYGQRVELYSALDALNTIAKVHGLVTEKREVSGVGGGPIKYEDAGLSDDERANRIVALLDRARARRAGQPDSE